ncbi:MAG: magnesium chelatase, partial [Chloroflexi bacterium]|nr:magnesium chelatase [Chloroflexota bacterium]
DVLSETYTAKLPEMGNLNEMVKRIETSDDPAAIASAIELILEGLHLNRRLNRDLSDGVITYKG